MVIETARRLGEEVGKTKEFKNYRRSQAALEKDKELLRTIGLLEEKRKALNEKYAKGMPIEVAEKRGVKELEQKVESSDVFATYIKAQGEYLGLMKKVDEAINEGMEGKPKSKEKG